jgi:hypothetical protein
MKMEIEEPLESRRSKRAKNTYTNTEHDLKNMHVLRKCHNSIITCVMSYADGHSEQMSVTNKD